MIKSAYRINVWVIVCLILLAVVMGVLNNLRVYDEQRVKWFGGPVIEVEDEA